MIAVVEIFKNDVKNAANGNVYYWRPAVDEDDLCSSLKL